MAKEKMQIYKCGVCGIVTEVLDGGAGALICCGQSCDLLTPKAAEEGREKHLPVVERAAAGIKVKVGSVPHPMEAKHYIQWIEVISDGLACRRFLQPGQSPEAAFCTGAQNITVREHCNVHGVWEVRQ